MIVFGYPRVSTDEQADKGNSLNEQMERMNAYCKAMGWDEPIFFIEDGFSAKSLSRPKMAALLKAVKENKGNGIVLTTKLDRLSRKLVDILNLNDYFNKYGFNYVSATEGFDTSTPAGRLVLQMLGMVAEFERERISERVRDNMVSIAKNTKKIITRPCYGYNVVDGEMIINIEESIIIREMATWVIEGKGAREVAKRLNARGLLTKEGNQWHDKVVRQLMQRETLVGTIVYNKTYKDGKNKVIVRPESEWIIKEDNHDPILTIEEHEQIKKMFEGRKTIGRHVSDDRYLLSGLVVCKHCGSKMNGKMNKNFSKRLNKENVHYQYLCDGYLKKATCYHHFARRDEIENLIIDRIEQLAVAAPGTLKLVISKRNEPKDETAQLKAQLEKIDKRMQKQIDAYNDDLIDAHDLKIASAKAKVEREKILSMLDESGSKKFEKEEAALQSRAKGSLKHIRSADRLKIKQSIREMIEFIHVSNGEDLHITWRGY